MALWASSTRVALRSLSGAALMGMALCGCSKHPAETQAAKKKADVPLAPSTSAGASRAATAPDNASKPSPLPPPPNDEFHLPFAKAAHPADDPPPNVSMPPDRTLTGKSVGKLYTDVVQIWDTIRFRDPAGRKIEYLATLETDLGTLEISLRPDVAPNHVRSFIALVKVGYFDGLVFDRVRNEKSEEDPSKVLDTIEAGCPEGTGETASGSIGYWLYPEIAKPEAKVTHEEGTLGACHGPELDTAGCRFYITLNAAPALDGNYTVFGKVSRGLEVARAIWKLPHIEEEGNDDGSHRPVKPVVIRRVVIHEQPAGGSNQTSQSLQY
jgi:peptidyl-prolyl cis-trans isomerase B (cyclophilin B)